jgi:hypothetical protein
MVLHAINSMVLGQKHLFHTGTAFQRSAASSQSRHVPRQSRSNTTERLNEGAPEEKPRPRRQASQLFSMKRHNYCIDVPICRMCVYINQSKAVNILQRMLTTYRDCADETLGRTGLVLSYRSKCTHVEKQKRMRWRALLRERSSRGETCFVDHHEIQHQQHSSFDCLPDKSQTSSYPHFAHLVSNQRR